MKGLLIGIVLLLTVFLGTACSKDEEPLQYSDFEHIEHWDDLDRLTGDKTIIYYYDPFCDICIKLEDEVTFLLDAIADDIEIYLIDAGYISEQGEPPFEVFGTVPSLIIFYEQSFEKWVRGSNPTLDYLRNTRDGLQE